MYRDFANREYEDTELDTMRRDAREQKISELQSRILAAVVRSATHHVKVILKNGYDIHIERFTVQDMQSITFLYGAWILNRQEVMGFRSPACIESIAAWLRDIDFTGAHYEPVG